MNSNLVHTGLMSYIIKNVFYSIHNKRNFTFLILFILTLSFSACGKGLSTSGDGEDKPKENLSIAVTEVDKPNENLDATVAEVDDTDGYNITCIVYGNGRFIAVGSKWISAIGCEGKIAWSNDGITWQEVKNRTLFEDKDGYGNYMINHIVYGNGKFVATESKIGGGQEEGKIAWSNDGITWEEAVIINTKDSIHTGYIAYGNGRFVAEVVLHPYAAAGCPIIVWSNDGKIWEECKIMGVKDTDWYYTDCIAYGNGRFVAGGSVEKYDDDRYEGKEGRIAWSNDGKTWTAIKNTTFDEDEGIYRIVYGNGRFVAVGSKRISDDDKYKIAWSNDGITWTAVKNTTFDGYAIDCIVYGNGKFIAGGNKRISDDGKYKRKIAWSNDGITWTAIKNTTSDWGEEIRIFYGNGKFIASSGSKMAYSNDGITWTAVKNTTFGPEGKAK